MPDYTADQSKRAWNLARLRASRKARLERFKKIVPPVPKGVIEQEERLVSAVEATIQEEGLTALVELFHSAAVEREEWEFRVGNVADNSLLALMRATIDFSRVHGEPVETSPDWIPKRAEEAWSTLVQFITADKSGQLKGAIQQLLSAGLGDIMGRVMPPPMQD